MADDYSARYNTELSPEEERAFQQWLAATGRQGDLYDYDMRGFWKAQQGFDARGHGSDEFKKPNHPTFSTDSQYSNALAQGGRWVRNEDGSWAFWASPHNVEHAGGWNALLGYFRDMEPGNRLFFQSRYDMRRRGR